MTRLARMATVAAAGIWAGVLSLWWAPVALVAVRRRRALLWAGIVGFVSGAAVGLAAGRPADPLPAGPVEIEGTVVRDLGRRWGWSGVIRTRRGPVLVRLDQPPPGRRVHVEGVSDGFVGEVAGTEVAATVTAPMAVAVDGGWHERIADTIRSRVMESVRPAESTGRALLVGFLTGDTSEVPAVVDDWMRTAGLSHLTAVSGSNVALFVWLVVIVAAPLAIYRPVRLALVLNGLLVFGFLTAWEPSVVRASATAALIGVGRFVGLPLDPVTSLASVAAGAILLDPSLASALGFQLSVAATAGLLVATRWSSGTAVRRALVATVGAQVAVAPILIATFGTVPLLSPLANLAAIPVVGLATVVGGVGSLLGSDILTATGALGAGIVASIAQVAAGWPQIGWVGFTVSIAVLILGSRGRLARRFALSIALASVVVATIPPRTLDGLAILSVGQGDATIISVPGLTMLVDGGPDAAVLDRALRRFGVSAIDLVVATHVHEDHLRGIVGIVDSVPIGEIWASFGPHSTPASADLVAAAETRGVPVRTPAVGDTVSVGSTSVEVVGPRRRYDGPNDQSIVLVVDLDGVRVLLAGDIEVAAQDELEVSGVDVLKVPHQGAGTSDGAWLERHAGAVSVVSVGPNDFGHPVPWVLEVLTESGARVHRTDLDGDYVLARPG